MPLCSFCGREFKTPKSLKKHQSSADYCKNTRYISHFCVRCNYKNDDIKALREHVLSCTVEEPLPPLSQAEKELKMKLQIEQFKSNLLAQLLKTHTDIDPDKLFVMNEQGIQIHNFPDGNVPLIVYDNLKGVVQKYTVNTLKKGKKKTIYRTVKNRVNLAEENPEERKEKIRQVDKDMEEMKKETFEVAPPESEKELERLFESIKTEKIYTRFLAPITKYRGQLLSKLPLSEYTIITKQHLKKITTIFKGKKYSPKKIGTIVRNKNGLSSLEQRLVRYEKYYNTRIEAEEIQRLKVSLTLNAPHQKEYKPFCRDEIYKALYNYSIALFTIRYLLKKTLINPYGFSNVIYFRLENDDDADPYRFYILDQVRDDGKRCWKLECRLDDLSNDFAHNLKKYCVTLFREVYYDVFSDNTYRENYKMSAPILQDDGEQLLQTILILSRPKTFCNILREMIVKHGTLQPTELDSFNITADDRLQKKQFANYDDDPKDALSTIKSLFDEISNEQADKMIEAIDRNL